MKQNKLFSWNLVTSHSINIYAKLKVILITQIIYAERLFVRYGMRIEKIKTPDLSAKELQHSREKCVLKSYFCYLNKENTQIKRFFYITLKYTL